MRRLVVANTAGDIIATGPHPDDLEQTVDGPTGHGFLPFAGQAVYEVEFPEGVSIEEILGFHQTHRVRVDEDGSVVLDVR